MEYVLLALTAAAVAFVLPIFLLFRTHKMKAQIAALETRVQGLIGEAITPEKQPVPQEDKPAVHQSWAPPEDRTKTPVDAQNQDVPKQIVPAQQPREPRKTFVFKPGSGEKIVAWIQKNWFFAVAAASLALAGVFLVQYGVDNGLLSPALRVTAAIIFGVILIGAGEYVRRKLGRDEEGSFALLPSVFSGAGLVSMFAGVISARMMYGLIGPEVAFVGLGLTGALAVILGWFYGPLLAIVGVFGALAAPFLVGGESESSHFLQSYFAGIAAVALTIDAIKRWAWLSALGLIGAYLASGLLYAANSYELYFIAFAILAMVLSVVIPMRSLTPKHVGPRVLKLDWRKKSEGDKPEDRKHSEFPTRLAAGAIIASSVFVGMAYVTAPSVFWVALAGIVILLVSTIIWMEEASALRDMAYFPAAIGLGIVGLEAGSQGDIQQAWLQDALRPELDFVSPVLAVLLLGALGISLAFAWRSSRNGDLKLVDAGIAAVYAPIAAIIAEVAWSPSYVLGSGNWAIYLSAIAIAMTVLAERFARKDGADRLRTAMFALSAISMLSFVLIVMLGSFALTLALAVMVAAAAWMGAKFNLPLFDRYMQVGVVTVTWRLILDPGLFWAFDAALWEFALAFLGVIALLIAAYFLKRKEALVGVTVMLESAIWSLSGAFVTILLIRYYKELETRSEFIEVSLIGLIWLISSANQLYRLRGGPELRRTRIALASIYGVTGAGFIAGALFALNPLFVWSATVSGPYVIDSLAAAYLLPGMLLAAVAFRFTHLPLLLRKGMGVAGALLGAFYVGAEIRRWWQGDTLAVHGVMDGELYSYTVAMMLAAAALLVLAFMRQSSLLRRLALVAVGLTVAKVYLIDMSGLDGLLRVVSFLVFGLVLIAMAWVNRILQKNEAKAEDAPSSSEP
ncbi:hypothetical protein A9Q96_15355 [Rhodobacterales bacterium 52_120_T64]|nr:hypothetical protein A9Q96_15355 [Rhodobacterales bacterium 52_120_T64]